MSTTDLPQDIPLEGRNALALLPDNKEPRRESVMAEFKSSMARDLRAVRWKMGSLWALGMCWLVLLTVILRVFIPDYIDTAHQGQFYSYCMPDSAFSFDAQYNSLAMSQFFQITMGSGDLSFTVAKILDVAFDIIVGRIGQPFLAFFTWKSFSTYTRYAMHKGSVTFDTFWSAFLDDDPSLQSTMGLIRDMTKRSGQDRASKAILGFFISSMCFILAFPTLISAMSGYQANNRAWIADKKDNMIPLENFDLILYVIHDGHRINLTDNYFVSPQIRFQEAKINAEIYLRLSWDYPCEGRQLDENLKSKCALADAVSTYVIQYGFLGINSTTGEINNVETVFSGTKLPEPALNVSAFYIPGKRHDFDSTNYSRWYGNNWTDPRTNTRPFEASSNMRVFSVGSQSNETYSLEYLRQNGSCKPLETYQWGVSILQFMIITILLLVWTIGNYLIWLKAHLSLLQQQDSKTPTKYEALLLLADTVNKLLPNKDTLKQHGCIDRVIATDLDRGRISAREDVPAPSFSLLCWAKQNVWWFTALLISTIYSFVVWVTPVPVLIFMGALSASLMFTLAVGTTQRSRLGFLVCGFTLLCALAYGFLIAIEGDWIFFRVLGRR